MSGLNINWVSTGPNHAVGTSWHVRIDIHDVPSGKFKWELSNDKSGAVYFEGYEATKEKALSTVKHVLSTKMGKMA